MNYEKILKRSWEIAKTHRFLWVFGMTLAAFSGFGSRLNLNLPGGSDGQNFLEMLKGVSDRTPRESSQVLGAYTDRLLDVFRGIPVWIWVVLLLSVAIAVLVAVLIGLYTRNWAKGAIIASIHNLEENSQASLETGSQQGKTAVKRFIWLEVIPPVFLLLALGLLLATGGLLFLVKSEVARMVLFILGVAVILILGLTGGMLIALGTIVAQQLVVRENLAAREAWRQGFRLARRHLKEMFLMGAINIGIGCALGCATALVLLTLAVIMLIVISLNKQIGLAVAAGAALIVMALALLSILLRGIYYGIQHVNLDAPLPRTGEATTERRAGMKQQPAGFWIRLQAYSIDVSLWLLTLTFPSWIMVNRFRTLEAIIPPTGALLFYLAFLYPALTLLYRVVLTMKIGGSIGKRLCGIKVVDERGNLMGFKPLLFRYLVGYIVSGMLYGLGFLWIARDKQKRGWHDHISASRVIVDVPKRWILGTAAMLILLFTLSLLVSSTVQSIKLNTGLHREIQTIIGEVQGRVLENRETPATIEPADPPLII